MNLQLLFENTAFVAVDKPVGVLTTPSRLGAADPRPCLGTELQRQKNQRLFPVHRLDEEVSGIVLFALTPESHRAAQSWFEQRTIQKTYQALTVPGSKSPDQGLWRSLLLRGKKRAFESPHGKESLTQAQWISERPFEGGQLAWEWRLQPLTGRSHQLRFECAKRQMPILGDTLYGGPPLPGSGIYLRHICLKFSEAAQSEWGLPQQIEATPLNVHQAF